MERLSGVVGSLSEAVFNQRTDDHILEIFSMGLTGQGAGSWVQCGFGFHERHMEALGWAGGSSDSASILEALESAVAQ